MLKNLTQQSSADEALLKCFTENALVTFESIKDFGSFHYFNGKFYCENGDSIGKDFHMGLCILREFAGDMPWYVITKLGSNQLSMLKNLHNNLKEDNQAFSAGFKKLMEA